MVRKRKEREREGGERERDGERRREEEERERKKDKKCVSLSVLVNVVQIYEELPVSPAQLDNSLCSLIGVVRSGRVRPFRLGYHPL